MFENEPHIQFAVQQHKQLPMVVLATRIDEYNGANGWYTRRKRKREREGDKKKKQKRKNKPKIPKYINMLNNIKNCELRQMNKWMNENQM